MAGDGINREGLEFRAGWCEALLAMAQQINFESLRCAKKETAGLQKAHAIGQSMFKDIVSKMKGEKKEGTSEA